MHSTEIGFLLLVAAGLLNASFSLPMKFTRQWAWENTWLAWSLFALLLLPATATWCTVPALMQVYGEAGASLLLRVAFFGACWGLAQVFFGIAVEKIGIALTFSLVLGTSAAVGALVPLLFQHRAMLQTRAGHELLLGIALMLLGVAICAAAGQWRENCLSGSSGARRSATSSGLILAVLCGCGASFQNFGIAFGAHLLDLARAKGASPAYAANAVWLPLLLGGAVPNLLYCIFLLRKNATVGRFFRVHPGHWLLALTMGVFWFGSLELYGAATARLGSLGPALGWPLFMSLIVVTASLLGVLTGEWRLSGRKPLVLQWVGVGSVIAAIVVLAAAGRVQT